MRLIIYFFKRLIHRNIPVYRFFYTLLTFNLNYCRQKLAIGQYPSKFGGMWTDHKDYPTKLASRQRAGVVKADMEPMLRQWREQGFVILEKAITDDLINQYLDEVAQLKAQAPSPLLVTAATLKDPAPYDEQLVASQHSVRTVDDYFFSEASRKILMHRGVMDFLELVFEDKPVLNQSLSFQQGSQQQVHQDTIFVRMNAPMQLAAIWVALEDVTPGSGELVYYAGSHRWEGFLFSGCFKHYDEERDGPEQLQQWQQWLQHEAERRRSELTPFLPRKGDVFIWHAGLAHGGAKVTRPNSTRLSLVGHYCPESVRPLYYYYKPAQRKRYDYGDYRYSSSYYR